LRVLEQQRALRSVKVVQVADRLHFSVLTRWERTRSGEISSSGVHVVPTRPETYGVPLRASCKEKSVEIPEPRSCDSRTLVRELCKLSTKHALHESFVGQSSGYCCMSLFASPVGSIWPTERCTRLGRHCRAGLSHDATSRLSKQRRHTLAMVCDKPRPPSSRSRLFPWRLHR